MGKNYKTLQRDELARQSLIIGIVSTVILLAAAFALPDDFPNSGLAIGSIFAMAHCYKHAQEETFNTHIANGGKKGSWGVAIGLGVLFMAFIVAIVVGTIMLLPESMFD